MPGNLKDKSVKNKTFMRFVISGFEDSAKDLYQPLKLWFNLRLRVQGFNKYAKRISRIPKK